MTGRRMNYAFVEAALAHDLFFFDAVPLGISFEIEIVKDSHRLPKVGLIAKPLVDGKPAHHIADDTPMFEMKLPLVVFFQQFIGFLRCRYHRLATSLENFRMKEPPRGGAFFIVLFCAARIKPARATLIRPATAL